jgi:hypothetical protein
LTRAEGYFGELTSINPPVTVPVTTKQFTYEQLNLAALSPTETYTDKQKAGRIAFRHYDAVLLSRNLAVSDNSKVKAFLIPRIRPDIANIDTTKPATVAYSTTDYSKYGLSAVSMIQSAYVLGILDVYATVDLADYLVAYYKTAAALDTLNTATSGVLATPWSALPTSATDANVSINAKAGALAFALVNKTLFTDSEFTYTHACYYRIGALVITTDAEKQKTDYVIAKSSLEYMTKMAYTPLEDIYTAEAYIAVWTAYTKAEIYSKVLPAMTRASKVYYYVYASITKSTNGFALPTKITGWTDAEATKYGIFSAVAKYPGLDLSVEPAANTIRDTVFAKVKTDMTASASLTRTAALAAAVAAS